jgi:hypothetical protein
MLKVVIDPAVAMAPSSADVLVVALTLVSSLSTSVFTLVFDFSSSPAAAIVPTSV